MAKTKTALLSAYDKTGLDVFAAALVLHDWSLLASRGTAKFLREKGILATDVADIVGEPILGHRVVTLSREIHAGLLATDSAEDQAELERLKIPRIDLVYVNLYPLRQEIAKPDCTLQSVLEKTDIGGPAMLRSAAKGRRIVLFRSSEFQVAIRLIKGGYAGREERIVSYLAALAEGEVSEYSHASSEFLWKHAGVRDGVAACVDIQELLR